MGSHGGAPTKIAILGMYRGPYRSIAGMSDIFVDYASLRLNLKKKSSSMPQEYSKLQSPARTPRESEMCSRRANKLLSVVFVSPE